ncbi:M48 family metalloprotease [Adhaeribacter sp. BT258]|uniref:M48 family metalloprotease n=1 Tax=Adhaeribacter terrigena TaxID=2793070 RepID=A0ABS1C186_9BACT|nr:M56 family metallopeptidase [Adhaeribacter terrigena]MBK0403164.1 M48 family metalloprotease [Adhaeribacter terrigena]
MKYADTFLSQELTQALGWTLLHSLWQGALVALALSVVLVFLNRHSAQVRYFISVTALFTTLALAIFTFFSLYREPVKITETAPLSTFSSPNPAVSTAAIASEAWYESLPFADFFATYFEKHLPLIVTIWFMGLLIMALKMLGGLAYVQRLKHYQAKPLGLRWQNKLSELQGKLNFPKPVALLESLQVKVPVAIGYLKPVILVPIGAVNGLTEKQVEAILAHELAHIYRHDYVFNLVQSVVETIFFYHPAMWWISASVRAERENCCDDIALNLCGDSIAFAGALAELEEMNFAAGPAMAMAFNGKRGTLLGRIKRLLHQPRRSASFSEGFIAACILMVSISAISLSAMAQLNPSFEEFPYYVGSIPAQKPAADLEAKATPINKGVQEVSAEPARRTAPEFASDLEAQGYSLSVSVAPEGDGEDIIIVKDRKGNIAKLYVNGKKVRKKDMASFQKIIDERQMLGGKDKRKKKEYASKEEVKEARKALKNMPDVQVYSAPQPRVYVYGTPEIHTRPQFNSRHRNYVPSPPAPHAPLAPPAPPVPLAPLAPMAPMAPVAPLPNASAEDKKEYEQELKEYEAEMKEYEQEIKEYEVEMKAYSENSGDEWKEYEKEMEEYGREMEKFSREMSVYGKDLAKNIRKQVYVSVPDNEELENLRRDARERTVEIRNHAAKDREIAARDRSRALERSAKEREKAAEARAKASEARAKAAETRAKAAKERSQKLEQIKTELRKDKLIGEKDKKFNYRISNDGLYINGKKQPQATFEKYKKRFHPGLEKSGKFSEVYNISED